MRPGTQLEALRAQAAVASVSSREHTDWGAYVNLVVPPSTPAVSPAKLVLEDLSIQVVDVPDGVDCFLFVNSGGG